MQFNGPDTGFLNVLVLQADGIAPVSDATVRIAPTGADDVIIEELTTDSSGLSESVPLAAPPLDLSLTPETEIQPYSEYDLTVFADGFEPVRVQGVQILPETRAVQNVRLPLLERAVEIPENIVIPPHTLWYEYSPKIPEDPVKPLPESQEFVVLPEPVVPEIVVVHDGVPDDPNAP
jgi:hypothetical protein